MTETVAAPPKGLEIFAAPRRRMPLPAAALKGGAKRSDALTKLGIHSVQDLLQHYPRRHIDRTKLRTVAQIEELEDQGLLEGEITVHALVAKIGRPQPLRGTTKKGRRRTIIRGSIGDETGSIEVVWFNQD